MANIPGWNITLDIFSFHGGYVVWPIISSITHQSYVVHDELKQTAECTRYMNLKERNFQQIYACVKKTNKTRTRM